MARGIRNKIKILIVEDDRELGDALQERLKKEGYDVQISPNGESLPEKSVRFRPNLILLDLNLPKRSGFLGLSDLKGNMETEGIPVCILTIRTDTPSWERGYGQGAAAYIVKPFDMSELVKRIKMLTR